MSKLNINKILFLFSFIIISQIKAQVYPLRTYNMEEYPSYSYVKDTNNELPNYEGTWKAVVNNKTYYFNFKKIKILQTYKTNPFYQDILVGKFKILNADGSILKDNTNTPDEKSVIDGGKFRKTDDKYSMIYSDYEYCGLSAYIKIHFTDASRTKLEWWSVDWTDIILPGCPYLNQPELLQNLPTFMVLIKQ